MQGVFPFQRSGASVSLQTTTNVSSSGAFSLINNGVVEIANLSTTGSAAYVFTAAGASVATAATTAMRTIPPISVVHERLTQGASFAAAIGIGAADVVLVFTPGTPNG